MTNTNALTNMTGSDFGERELAWFAEGEQLALACGEIRGGTALRSAQQSSHLALGSAVLAILAMAMLIV